jgi:hypothetical protein
MNPPRRDLRNEIDYLPRTVRDVAELHECLVAAGQTPAVASGISSWLARKAAGHPDLTDSATRARYRKILAALEGWPPGPTGRRRLPSAA